MAFALLSRSRSKTQGSVKPVPKGKSVRGQHSADSRFGFAKPVFQPQTAALSTVPVIQAKLKVGEPNDKFEQEADRVADEVMHMPDSAVRSAAPLSTKHLRISALDSPPTARFELPDQAASIQHQNIPVLMSEQVHTPQIQRLCPECEEELRRQPEEKEEKEEKLIQTKEDSGRAHEVASDLESKMGNLRGGGEPLPQSVRAFFEPRFGHNFSPVRVHTDAKAAESAEAVNAFAYTVGNHVVFGAGQYEPGSFHGQRLLAHELTHVVQQNGSQSLFGEAAGGPDISHAPAILSRNGPSPSDEARKKEEAGKNEAAKKAAIKRHTDQQHKVAGFLDNARKIKPDPKKGLRDPDNLIHNTVGLLDGGKLTLTVLSPTHSSANHHFDSRVRFDVKGNHFGGDYPAVPIDGLEGVVFDDSSAAGKLMPPSSTPATPNIKTLPEKVEEKIERSPVGTQPTPAKPAPAPAKTPPPAPAPFVPGDIFLFTRGSDITEGSFKNTFVHEGQHIADLSSQVLKGSSANDILEGYKTEFRAFWIQPPRPRGGELAPEAIERLPEPTGKADNSRKVTISKPEACKICKPANESAPAEVKTELKNPRQEVIFWHIITNYQSQQYDCCYVYNENFRKAVNRFAYPESVNLINSDRLMNLNLEVQKLKPSMTNLVSLVTQLDALDWAFLNDPKLSKPFWDALKNVAPGFVYKGVTTLAKKALKNPVTAPDVKKALSAK